MKTSRQIATIALHEVLFKGRSLNEVNNRLEDHNEKSFIKALLFGVCRWYEQLEWIARQLLSKPINELDETVYCLILVGLYEYRSMHTASHAVINETVNTAIKLKAAWAKGLVNAVLRNYQRREEELIAGIKKNTVALYSHPAWLISKIKSDWPEQWEQILEANNQHPPMSLRVNTQKISVSEYANQLNAPSITLEECPEALILEKPMPVSDLPHFDEGYSSIQDPSAQLAAHFLDVKSGQRVLDACAAPGGKTMHILELNPDLSELVAIDIDEKRLEQIKENAERCGQKPTLIVGDITKKNTWWDKKCFDRILLDAACSAVGVIRRHPDIKVLRQEKDIQALTEQQAKMLKTIWSTLKPGGLLLYVTCSILKCENDDVIAAFLAENTDAKVQQLDTSWGRSTTYGKQSLPQENFDGFYYTRIMKLPT